MGTEYRFAQPETLPFGQLQESIHQHIKSFEPQSLRRTVEGEKLKLRGSLYKDYGVEFGKHLLDQQSKPFKHYLDTVNSYEAFIVQQLLPWIREPRNLFEFKKRLPQILTWEMYRDEFPRYLEESIEQAKNEINMLQSLPSSDGSVVLHHKKRELKLKNTQRNLEEFQAAMNIYVQFVKSTL